MQQKRKVSKSFRKYLTGELAFWKNQQIITDRQSDQISSLYGLENLKNEMLNTLFSVIYLISSSLIGIGIISFVAAHWSGIPKNVKLAILFGAMLGFHFIGFYLWQIKANAARLGHSLVVLGTLVFGANIGLIAQIYHIDGHFSNAAMVWAAGAAVMGYMTGSGPNMFIAIAVSFAGFIAGMERLGWHPSFNPFAYYPIAAAAVFWIYCFWKRSAFLFAISCLAVGVGVIVTSGFALDDYYGVVLGVCALTIFYAGFAMVLHSSGHFKPFAKSLMFFAVLFLLIFIYLSSYYDVARDVVYELETDELKAKAGYLTSGVLCVLLGLVLTGAGFVKGARKYGFGRLGIVLFLSSVICGSLAIYTNCMKSGYPVVIGANFLWLTGACYSLSGGIRQANRAMFWVGVLMLGVLVISRALEYDTELMVKAAAFVGCGVALLVGGIIFEKYAKKRRIKNG